MEKNKAGLDGEGVSENSKLFFMSSKNFIDKVGFGENPERN